MISNPKAFKEWSSCAFSGEAVLIEKKGSQVYEKGLCIMAQENVELWKCIYCNGHSKHRKKRTPTHRKNIARAMERKHARRAAAEKMNQRTLLSYREGEGSEAAR